MKLNAFGKTRSGVTGVPWRDLSEEEYVHYTETVGDLSAYFDPEPVTTSFQPEPLVMDDETTSKAVIKHMRSRRKK
jgi:hypothetical protein